ncbi:GntR family transcriptional regulator [Priestia aryabhattai]|uniref:GntR family transcriptional regulator n=1 Tax=Priestia aryabhattai TaxID=412384 RepID=UPI002816277B|nr:GntR family transcriptional regulator [Priestia aryabhattai]
MSRISVNAKEFAYEQIKKDILQLNLLPGTKISEKIISDQLDVSRTPIREAFLKLAQEELLTIIPQSGTFVSLIHLDHAEEARLVRELIEANIVGICCENLTKESAFSLEVNLKMQEQLVSQEPGEEEIKKFLELDEEFHKELFVCCGKQRTWKMIQSMVGHLNRLRLLRLQDTQDLDWSVIINHHKEIFEAICEKDKQKAENLMSEHIRLMITEKDILLQKFPEYFLV